MRPWLRRPWLEDLKPERGQDVTLGETLGKLHQAVRAVFLFCIGNQRYFRRLGFDLGWRKDNFLRE